MRIYNKLTQIAIVLAVSFFLLCSMCFGESITYAAPERGAAAFEAQNVIDDLKGSTLNGKTFSEADYQASTIKDLQLINFVEYGYFESDTSNYNLYFYIYNPQQFNIVLDSRFNQIEFRVGSKGYDWYDVKYLNSSGVLYKFKVELTSAQRSNIISTVDPAERVYEVSGVELFTKGDINATDYEVKNKFIYTGSGDTLNCTSEGLAALTLEVHPTTYRATGSNGKSSSTYDTLHSVYFSIPNTYLQEYEDLTAVHARWINATTMPMLVTGGDTWSDPYAYIDNIDYSGKTWYEIFYENAMNNAGKESTNPYIMISDYLRVPGMMYTDIYCDYIYNSGRHFGSDFCVSFLREMEFGELHSLPIVFQGDTEQVKDSIISVDTIIDYFKTYSDKVGNKTVADKYSSQLFSKYDTQYTEVNKRSDETFNLTSQMLGYDFWMWWTKDSIDDFEYVQSETLFNGKAIQLVKSTDFKSTVEETCDSLFVGKSEYEDFESFFKTATTNGESVYLLRYKQSESYSQAAGICNRTSSNITGGYDIAPVYINAYLATQEVQLNFDIIDVTFTKGDVVTIIGIVASPIDIFSPIQPPSNLFIPDEFWKIGCIILGVLAVALVASFIIKNNADKPALVCNGYTRGSPPVINNYYGTTKKRRKR